MPHGKRVGVRAAVGNVECSDFFPVGVSFMRSAAPTAASIHSVSMTRPERPAVAIAQVLML
jgi:hypothetical protein